MDWITSLNGLPGVIAISVILTIIFMFVNRQTFKAQTQTIDVLRDEIKQARTQGNIERIELKEEIKEVRSGQIQLILETQKEIGNKIDLLLLDKEPIRS